MSQDMGLFLRNRARFSLQELAKYRGRFVAWSPDGTRIVASCDHEEDLDRLVRAAGEKPQDCIVGAVPEADAVLGGTGVS